MADDVFTVQFGNRRFPNLKSAFADVERRLRLSIDRSSQEVSKQLLETLFDVGREMFRLHGTPWSPQSGSGRNLRRRTGGGLKGILRTIKVKKARDLDGLMGQIGAPFPMSVHEDGATIRAKRAQFLAIPLPEALSPRGVPLRAGPRSWPDTFVARSRAGNLLIFRKLRGGGIVPLFVLKRSVKIPPRLRMEETLVDHLPMLERRVFESISRQLDKI